MIFHVPFSEGHELEVTENTGWVNKLCYISIDTYIHFKKTQHKPHNFKVELPTDAECYNDEVLIEQHKIFMAILSTVNNYA